MLMPGVIGAVLPDAPMFVFYAVEKLKGTPEQVIWREAYYRPHWQNFIDVFNSIPLIGLGWAITLAAGSTVGMYFFASMFLHMLGDLPLHHDDAHRHFFPFSDWRFMSPFSYWDPNHHGRIMSILEIVAVLVSCLILWQIYPALGPRLMLGTIGLLYLSYFVYAATVWA
jgi:hypothetical protein